MEAPVLPGLLAAIRHHGNPRWNWPHDYQVCPLARPATCDDQANVQSSNIGNDANALWRHYDSSVDEPFLVSHQQIHVSILSVFNFVGRLLSGKATAATICVLSPHKQLD